MALVTAVLLESPDSRPLKSHELFEYPQDIDELDDLVLEHIVTDGSPYSLLVDSRRIEQNDLDTAQRTASVLRICVKVEAPEAQRRAGAKVVLKRVDVRPVQKHDLDSFPEDLDELDDVVLNHLVTSGDTHTMRVDGQILTDDMFQEYKQHNRKLVIHVSGTQAASLAGSQSGASSFYGELSPAPRAQERGPKLTQDIVEFKNALQDAEQMIRSNSSNLLVEAMKFEEVELRSIQKNAQELMKRHPKFGLEADELISTMCEAFDTGLTELTATRRTLANIQKAAEDLSIAFFEGNTVEARLRLVQLNTFSGKMSSRSQQVETQLTTLKTDLGRKYAEYQDKCRQYNTFAASTGTLTLAAGVGTAVTGGGAALTGLVIEGTAAVAGWCGTSVGAVAATPVGWNPVGLGLMAGCGLLAVLTLGLGCAAKTLSDASDATERMGDITGQVRSATSMNKDLWNGIRKNIVAAESAVEDLSTFGPEDRRRFREAMLDSAKSLASLLQSVDEYLVFVSEKKLYPVTFNVRTIVGSQEYELIKTQMQIDDSRANQP